MKNVVGIEKYFRKLVTKDCFVHNYTHDLNNKIISRSRNQHFSLHILYVDWFRSGICM